MPLTQNIVFSAKTFADAPAVIGSPDNLFYPTLPAANMQNGQVKRVARMQTVDPYYTNFWIDLQRSRNIGMVAIVGHNLTSSAKWRYLLSDQPNFGSIIYDSGELAVWPAVEQFGVLPWGVFRWGGVLSADEEQLYTTSSFSILDPQRRARYIKIYLINAANADGFIDVGRVWVGPIYQPSLNFVYGYQIGFEDLSQVSYSRGGQRYVDAQEVRRIMTLQLQRLPKDELLSQCFDGMDRVNGIKSEMIVIPFPMDSREIQRQALYCSLRQMSPYKLNNVNQWDHEFVLEENL